MSHYAGVGVRKAEPEQLNLCYRVGRYMALHGWILHTGLAEGADRQFCLGALEHGGTVVLHVPFVEYGKDWAEGLERQFGKRVELNFLHDDDTTAFQAARQYHPAGKQLSLREARFHACNYRIRVPIACPPVTLTVALQGERPQEQEFGYRLGTALSIPSILLRGLTPEQIKASLDPWVKPSAEVPVTLECWSKRPQPEESTPPPSLDAAKLLPVTTSNMTALWTQAQSMVEKFKSGDDHNHCPCCGRVVALKQSNISPATAKWLIALTRIYFDTNREWVRLNVHPELTTKGGDYAKLKFWDLIIAAKDTSEAENPHGRGSGVWRPTNRGVEFVLNHCSIPRYCYTYNDQLHSHSTEELSIVSIITDPTEYNRLVDGLEKLANGQL